jgi:SAM-dependent methyltransferase
MATSDFYDTLTPYYHLIYADWEVSIGRQGRALNAIIRSTGGTQSRSVLDTSCGIGTQSIGLAQLGYEVTASDLSPSAVERAQREASQRGFSIRCSVADMRGVHAHHRRLFDVVIACDNSIPHLLSDADIFKAFEDFHRCLAPGGLCLISVRDYATLDMSAHVQLHHYGVRHVGSTRYVLLQVLELHAPLYDTTFYVIEHSEGAQPVTHASQTTYYAVSITTLMRLMEQAGFSEVRRIDGEFFQPVLVGCKRHEPAQDGATKKRAH